jgi:hypothetical protein
MIQNYKVGFFFRLTFLLIVILGLFFPMTAQADGDPERFKLIEVEYTEYEWWLVYWQDGTLACNLYLDQDQLPSNVEILNQCGKKIFDLWINSSPCIWAESNQPEACSGMYLFPRGSQKNRREMEIVLPAPKIWVELVNCISVRGTELCAELPSLKIIAEEPLPNERIEKVQGTINKIPFVCFDSTCELPLRVTGEEGYSIEFWAESSFGDSTNRYQGRIRVAESINDIPYTSGWRVDIVSDTADFTTMSGCAQIWESFPPLGTLPEWLSNPQNKYLLETDQPYTYLAGQLIHRGYVDTSDCE